MADKPRKKPDPDDVVSLGSEGTEGDQQPIPSMSSVFSMTGAPLSSDDLASLTDVLISEQGDDVAAAVSGSDLVGPPADFAQMPPLEVPGPLADESALPDLGEVALVGAPSEEAAEAEKEAKGPSEKKGVAGTLAGRQSLLEAVALGCLAVALLAVGFFGVIFYSTAVYAVALVSIGYGIWLGRKTNSVYTVFLGCALAAAVTMAYVLWLEMGQYQFDFKARTAKARTSAMLSAPSGSADVSAAAWSVKV